MKLAEKFFSELKFSSIMRLASLLHDSGKMNNDFNSYIRGKTNFRKGEIDHSYAGTKYISDQISMKRMDISDRCAKFAEAERGICRLTVPTDSGKTVPSLRFAVNYCKKFGKEKIFYIAPFMSVLEQNSDVLRSVSGDEILLETPLEYRRRDRRRRRIERLCTPVRALEKSRYRNNRGTVFKHAFFGKNVIGKKIP